jgi:protein ImuA
VNLTANNLNLATALAGGARGTGGAAIRIPLTPKPGFTTGLHELDAAAPGGLFQFGAVHELLWEPPSPPPLSIAALFARAATKTADNNGAIIWSDPDRRLYPPALAAAGVDLRRLILLRCQKTADELWALAECLRCRGVGAAIASVTHLSRVQTRRLQLAAEQGGGAGLLLRPLTPGKKMFYAAATRWLVQPHPPAPTVPHENQSSQQWNIQLLHGHGGAVGRIILLEINRETGLMRASSPLAHRPPAPLPQRITA